MGFEVYVPEMDVTDVSCEHSMVQMLVVQTGYGGWRRGTGEEGAANIVGGKGFCDGEADAAGATGDESVSCRCGRGGVWGMGRSG